MGRLIDKNLALRYFNPHFYNAKLFESWYNAQRVSSFGSQFRVPSRFRTVFFRIVDSALPYHAFLRSAFQHRINQKVNPRHTYSNKNLPFLSRRSGSETDAEAIPASRADTYSEMHPLGNPPRDHLHTTNACRSFIALSVDY